MKNVFAALLLVLTSSLASAGEPFQSPDALEDEVRACLMKNAKSSRCMEVVLAKRILPGNDQLVSVAAQMDQLLQKWLSNESIYALHLMRTKKSGDIYEKRTYMIEDTSGELMTFNLSMLKRLGKWYVLQFNLSSTSDRVNAVLQGD